MKHFHDITVLTTNVATNPVVYKFNIDKGLITEASVFFPPGCHGVVLVKIFFQTHQILPRNQENWARGNNGWWTSDMYYPVTAAPMQIEVIAYTAGANYDHVITVCVELMPWEQVPAWNELIAIMERIASILGVPKAKPAITEMKP